MKVYLGKTDQTKELSASSVKDLLSQLKINSTTVIVSKNGELVTEETSLKEDDEVKIIPVISGGKNGV